MRITRLLIQECNLDLDDPFLKDLYLPLPTVENGYLLLLQRPGIGFELNEKVAVKHPYKPYDRRVIREEDGAVGLD